MANNSATYAIYETFSYLIEAAFICLQIDRACSEVIIKLRKLKKRTAQMFRPVGKKIYSSPADYLDEYHVN